MPFFFSPYRSEEVEESCEYELRCRRGATGSQGPDPNALLTSVDIQAGQRLFCGQPPSGHSAAHGPVITNTGLKPHEQQRFQEKLSASENLDKASSQRQSLQEHANRSAVEKPHAFMSGRNSYSDFNGETPHGEIPRVHSCLTANGVELWEGHRAKIVCVQVYHEEKPSILR